MVQFFHSAIPDNAGYAASGFVRVQYDQRPSMSDASVSVRNGFAKPKHQRKPSSAAVEKRERVRVEIPLLGTGVRIISAMRSA